MADYHCWPLWHAGGTEVGCIDPETLPLTATTKQQLSVWQEFYDSKLNQAVPQETFWTRERNRSSTLTDVHCGHFLPPSLALTLEFFISLHLTDTFSNPTSNAPTHALRRFFVRRTPRACHGGCEPPSPTQPPRQSRGLLALLDARTRHRRSKTRSGHRMPLDNQKSFGGEFSHARRLL